MIVIIPALLFLVSSTISPGCLAFSIPMHIRSSDPSQRLTLRTGQPWRHDGSTYHLVRFMVPDYDNDDKDDQTFASPTMNPPGDVRTPDGNTVTSKELDRLVGQIFALEDVFERSKNELDQGFEPPTKVGKQFSATMSFAPPKPSPVIDRVVEKPSKDLTGVEPNVTSICATISQQIYNATTIDSFDLGENSGAEFLFFDNHTSLNDVVPPFAVALLGDMMILAWRGSQTIMDWASDFSSAPVTSSRWSHLSQYVKAHSGYASMVESDFTTHEDALIKTIQAKKIKQLVTTGHSLGGGMAQVSHLFLEGQLRQPGSRWNKLLGKLTVRSIAFAAPMTIMSTMAVPFADDQTNSFLRKISNNSCNIVYGPDVVPHATGDVAYVINVTKAVIPDLVNEVPFWSGVLRFVGIPSRLTGKVQDLTQNDEGVKNLLKVVVLYNHLGKIIYYTDKSPNPVVLRDNEFQSASLPLFRNYGIKVPEGYKKHGKLYSVKDQLTDAHLYFPAAFAYNLPNDKQGRN